MSGLSYGEIVLEKKSYAHYFNLEAVVDAHHHVPCSCWCKVKFMPK